ncbi:hypothetical protein CORC01_00050 [Colletotrichum orchidophilum]|uniref:Aminoglycoside phosphotransferase domain-containing protein n=1 Tax=Colletotrichum orchidophilum TaxID=1209926 RepID=A0A1G4BT23_9PEZI|nr:uncharacterized protein CORC01_00050 [Colletotrichum orchidophilum]OHF04579.1 hypothetical protein CORC01_00050 [Colletotrichum orchidophilum]
MKNRAPVFGLTTVDDNAWLVGDRALLSRRYDQIWSTHTPGLISTWTASDQAHYAILDVAGPPPPSRPWEPEDDPKLVHIAAGGGIVIEAGADEAGVAQLTTKCVYSIGDVFIKMHHTIHCDSTDEDVTITELQRLLPDRTFTLPSVRYHARYDNRYFLITSVVPGQTAAQLWWDLDDTVKDRYAALIAKACIEVATISSDKLGIGIDGTIAPNGRFGKYLTRKDLPNILANCKALKLDVEPPFHLFHEDLGPTNVLIDTQNESIGIIDWQAAEYVPREWIGMNFARAMAMVQDPPIPSTYQSNDYAQRVWKALQRHGFSDDGSVWLSWKWIDWRD